MKDRFGFDDWPEDWVEKVIADFPKLSRETKLFLAKILATIYGETSGVKARPAKQEETEPPQK